MTGLRAAVARVVDNGNCSGCGGCAALTSAVSMHLDDRGFLRPRVTDETTDRGVVGEFARICPGVRVDRPAVPAGGGDHPVLGPYVSIWAAWAADDEIRWRGSSGGVLTALSAHLLAAGAASTAIAAGPDPAAPLRPATLRITSRDEALAAAGSRYAPVANAAGFDRDTPPDVFVGKPCEADSVRRLVRAGDPLVLSFFCAGVPSQTATERLGAELGVRADETVAVRYRGRGWPGDFVVTAADGHEGRVPYEIAWGQKLGRDIQDRCKICPDGTGMHADVTVGDLWETDEAGYPSFESADGVSVAIARTARGHELLLQAQGAGAIVLRPVGAEAVAAVQPSQVRRRTELPGRLAGRRLAGMSVPRFSRFRMVRTAVRRPRLMLRAARGTRSRSRGGRP